MVGVREHVHRVLSVALGVEAVELVKASPCGDDVVPLAEQPQHRRVQAAQQGAGVEAARVGVVDDGRVGLRERAAALELPAVPLLLACRERGSTSTDNEARRLRLLRGEGHDPASLAAADEPHPVGVDTLLLPQAGLSGGAVARQNDSTEPAGSVIGSPMLVVESWVCRRATPARPAV